MRKFLILALLLPFSNALATRPTSFTELLDYVIQAPDQTDTNTCLFVGGTGSMEILLNQKFKLRNQMPGDRFDLSERFIIHQSDWGSRYFVESAFMKFNWKEAVLQKDMPFIGTLPDGTVNYAVWNYPENFSTAPRITVPKVKSTQIFIRGGKWATDVLDDNDVEEIKVQLAKYKKPILINYNDEGYWHVVNIVGYDDTLEGDCYDATPKEECAKNTGAFYIRDHFGVRIEVRDTDWFRIKANAAFRMELVKE